MASDLTKRMWGASWLARIAFFAVFAVNAYCALCFIFDSETYLSSYALTGEAGKVAIQGLGVAFLMWNATYPLFIAAPRRFSVLGWVILAQQAIGLVGESLIYASILGHGLGALEGSILRFIVFDGAGFLIMAVSFAFLLLMKRRFAKGAAAGRGSLKGEDPVKADAEGVDPLPADEHKALGPKTDAGEPSEAGIE